MDLALTSGQYCPIVGANKEYVDHLPMFFPGSSYICPCHPGHEFTRRSALGAHFRTKRHKRHMEIMNANRQNHLQQYTEQVEENRSLRLTNARLQKELDISRQRLSGMKQVMRSRDERILELETSLIMLAPQEDTTPPNSANPSC